jgi:hypothetical protein
LNTKIVPAGPIRRRSPGWRQVAVGATGGGRPKTCVPGTTRVAPFSSLNGTSARNALATW